MGRGGAAVRRIPVGAAGITADNEKTLGETPRLWPFHRYLTRTTLDGDACPLDPRPR